MRAGGANPWAVDYSEEIQKAQTPIAEETLIDKAKSFSFWSIIHKLHLLRLTIWILLI